MKRVLLVFLIAVAITGCSTSPAKLSESERRLIDDGKLIKFTDYNQGEGGEGDIRLEKAKLAKGVYVCVTPIFPSNNCYPQLSKMAGKYLSRSNITVSNEPANSDAILYVAFGFANEVNPNMAIIMVNEGVMYSLEQVLETNDNTNISQNIGIAQNDFGGVAGATLAGAALGATALQMAGGISMGGSGHYTDRYWFSIQMAEVNTKTASNNITNLFGKKLDGLWDANPQMFTFAGRYIGPRKANEIVWPLFDEAMRESMAQITVN